MHHDMHAYINHTIIVDQVQLVVLDVGLKVSVLYVTYKLVGDLGQDTHLCYDYINTSSHSNNQHEMLLDSKVHVYINKNYLKHKLCEFALFI